MYDILFSPSYEGVTHSLEVIEILGGKASQIPIAGSEVSLLTHLVVREDAHLLFGFATTSERHMFRQLIKVNGIGAKVALSILSSIESNELTNAIKTDDTNMLIKIPGINIVGLTLGQRPPFKSKGFWLNAEGKDVLHLSSTKNNEKKEHHVNATFDHLAFSASNIKYYEEILNENNIPFTFREVPEIGTKQIFFKDPVGNGVELIFT